MKHTISGLVKNRAGILAQIVGAFKKFDVNIKSVAVSETDLFETSRLTIVVEGHDKEVKKVTVEVKKLRDVLEIDDLSRQGFLDRELALVKVHFNPDELNRAHADRRGLRRPGDRDGQADDHLRDRRRRGADRRFHQRPEFLWHSRVGPQRASGVETG